MTASAGSDAIVYEQAGYIYLLETSSGRAQRLNIEVTGDLPWARPQFKKVVSMIRNSALSPTGIRAIKKRKKMLVNAIVHGMQVPNIE